MARGEAMGKARRFCHGHRGFNELRLAYVILGIVARRRLQPCPHGRS